MGTTLARQCGHWVAVFGSRDEQFGQNMDPPFSVRAYGSAFSAFALP
jgi:hypothetical protein